MLNKAALNTATNTSNAYEEYSVLRAIEGANFNICNYRVQLTGETEKKLINIVLY